MIINNQDSNATPNNNNVEEDKSIEPTHSSTECSELVLKEPEKIVHTFIKMGSASSHPFCPFYMLSPKKTLANKMSLLRKFAPPKP